MSRICVKNLPKYVNEDRIRDFFSQKGEVTDAKLMRTKDGKSRQFAFVGFRTEMEAQEALNFFNNTFMDTCKIRCEVACKVNDPNLPRPWSRYSVNKDSDLTANKKENKGIKAQSSFLTDFRVPGVRENEAKDLEDKKNDDPQLQDFLEIMQPRAKSKLWANDVFIAPPSIQDVNAHSEETKLLKNNKKKSTKMVKNAMDVVEMEEPMRIETSSSSDDNKQAAENGRLFVRNLPYTATEDDLTRLFSQYGDVSQVHLVVDKETRRSKGIAFVLYTLPESANRALKELDYSIFQGRPLHVMPAKSQNSAPEKDDSQHTETKQKKNFKQQREEQRKTSEASGNTQAWNSLFMRSDTVVENIARKNGISKSELLELEGVDLAVRIALGETHVIAETKKSLTAAGINIVALDEFASKKTENAKRSNHVILVKNLPYNCNQGELASMFGKFGSLDKVILPPTRTLALIIFLEAAEARVAFKDLAYRRYKDAPLYLEWAPDNILCPNKTLDSEDQKNVVGEQIVKKLLLEQSEGVPEEDIDPDRAESRSIFVKNLNFKTSDETLRTHFSDNMKNGTIKSVKVKKHIKNEKFVSAGFGFIEFDSVDTATSVCKNLQGTVLDGHALILQLCQVKNTEHKSKKDEKDKSTTKLIVRNVAFEATKKDLKQLFSPFGKIKSLRLPMKFGNHRGFAFVEFVTKQEAKKASEALSSTHLYGRHLVIEKAKEGETLEELRARVAAQFDEHHGTLKLSKKRKEATIVDEDSVKFARLIE